MKTAVNAGQANKPAAEERDSENPERRHSRRVWLLSSLLLALVVLLATREDMRRHAQNSAFAAASYVAYEVLGLSPRTIFVWRLHIAGLSDSALAKRWRKAVALAGEHPVKVERRYHIATDFAVDSVEAHIYQLELDRGEELIWRLARSNPTGGALYASLERQTDDSSEWSTVTDLVADDRVSRTFIDRDGRYRVVLQPALFASVQYSLTMASGGSLAFPVRGASAGDIKSWFGAPRDGGARDHHGVDIFAERGTPVVAVSDGSVRTGTGGLGGKKVWLTGGFLGIGSARYYYAHLDDFAVASGDSVSRGDVLGYVGNTGNARTTPPHLHFGIYTWGGPVDPAAFVQAPPEFQ